MTAGLLLMKYFIQVATRVAYGTALAKLGKSNPRVIGMDGDTKNSTFSIKLKVTCFAFIDTIAVAIICIIIRFFSTTETKTKTSSTKIS